MRTLILATPLDEYYKESILNGYTDVVVFINSNAELELLSESLIWLVNNIKDAEMLDITIDTTKVKGAIYENMYSYITDRGFKVNKTQTTSVPVVKLNSENEEKDNSVHSDTNDTVLPANDSYLKIDKHLLTPIAIILGSIIISFSRGF